MLAMRRAGGARFAHHHKNQGMHTVALSQSAIAGVEKWPDVPVGWAGSGWQVHALSCSSPMRSSAARAAHREQARSYICFGPIIPGGVARDPLAHGVILRFSNKAVARGCHGHNWPETNGARWCRLHWPETNGARWCRLHWPETNGARWCRLHWPETNGTRWCRLH